MSEQLIYTSNEDIDFDKDFKCEASYAQKRMWLLHQMNSSNPAYNVTGTYILLGQIDSEVLRDVLHLLIKRHESFRTYFSFHDNNLMQFIKSNLDFEIPIINENNLECSVEDFIKDDIRSPFNINIAPLFRVFLIKQEDYRHILHLNMHHIITDAWSFEVILRDLFTIYNSKINNKEIVISDLPFQYADFSLWQKNWIESDECKKQLSYWKKNLTDSNNDIKLPYENINNKLSDLNNGDFYTLEIPLNIVNQIHSLNKSKNNTMFLTMLAVYKILLYRYSGEKNITVGTPITNRDKEGLENQVGLYTNTIALKTEFENTDNFLDVLSKLKNTLLNAIQNKDVPFDKVVEELNPEREYGQNPLFQVMFVFRKEKERFKNIEGVKIETIEFEKTTSKFHQLFIVTEKEDGIELKIEYNKYLFSAATIEKMAKYYVKLLQEVVINTNKEISVLSLSEKELIHNDKYNLNKSNPFNKYSNISQLFDVQSTKTPKASAIIFNGSRFTFEEVSKRANQVANYLVVNGVVPENRIGIYLNKGPEAIIAILGVLKAGAAYVPIDPLSPSKRVDYILKDSEVNYLITETQVYSKEIKYSKNIIFLDKYNFNNESIKAPDINTNKNNLAYIIYTSGSTGKPKGVLVEHKSVFSYIFGIQNEIFKEFNNVQLQVSLNAPLNFDASIKQLQLLFFGHCIHIITEDLKKDPIKCVEYIKFNRLDIFDCTPSQLKILFEAGISSQTNSLKLILVGGEAIDKLLWSKMAKHENIKFYNHYGPTECTVNTTVKLVEGDTPSIGKPLLNTYAYLLDKNLNLVPEGVVGEIFIGGENVARGYLNLPHLTNEKFISFRQSERLYRTGDLGRILPDGEIEYVGRLDNQVKIRGFRIELGEIENIIRSHKDVKEVFLKLIDLDGNKYIVAYLTMVNHNTENVKVFLSNYLPYYMMPSYFVLLENFPLTHNGKIDISLLPTPIQKRENNTKVVNKDKLIKIWEEILKVDISDDDNFFHKGGNSLLAAKLLIIINREYHSKLEYQDIFKYSTIRKMRTRLMK